MTTIGSSFTYWKRFVTSPEFQEEQFWVSWLVGKLSVIHHHVWTGIRFPGALVTILATDWNFWLGIGVLIFFALTDWIDGKVARFNGLQSGRFGAILDGLADKFFALPIIWWWGRQYAPDIVFFLLFIIEGGGNIFLYLFSKKNLVGKLNSVIGFLFPGKHLPEPVIKSDVYEHLMVGKVKFAFQICLIAVLWIMRYVLPAWPWWALCLNTMLAVITLLAFFSVACKINPAFIHHLADFLTLGNGVSGILSIAMAANNQKMAAALILLAAIFDIADGYIARKTKKNGTKWGGYLDDFGDFISFGLAPAWLFFLLGMPVLAALIYVLATAIRLINFTFFSQSISDFQGVPSTAVAIFLASIVFQNAVSEKPLAFYVLAGAGLEVLFIFHWYHFRKFIELPIAMKMVFVLVFLASTLAGYFGQGISLCFFLYLITFFKPVARLAWHW